MNPKFLKICLCNLTLDLLGYNILVNPFMKNALPVHCCLSFVELILPKYLEGFGFQHFQFLLVQIINVLDGAYLKSEYNLPV